MNSPAMASALRASAVAWIEELVRETSPASGASRSRAAR
jgi:hypothetical protein